MIGLKSIVSILAIFTLFFGIISSLLYDTLYIIAHPSAEAGKKLVEDMAKTVVNSQGEIANAVDQFSHVKSKEYATFLLSRILAGSLVTLFLIWIFYKAFRFFVESPKPTDKLMLMLLSIVMVWIICVISSYYLGKVDWVPFHGWVKLAEHRQEIANFILNNYFGD